MQITGKWAPCHVAWVERPGLQRAPLREWLEQAGCTAELFEDVSELLAALGRGKRFALVLVVEGDVCAWNQLSAVCSVIGMPALLLAGTSDGDRAAAWLQAFPDSPLFDFASVDLRSDELDRRMSRLLHRGKEHRDHFTEHKGTVFGGYAFHEGLRAVVHEGREIVLQPRQFELALVLFRNVGRVLGRPQLWASLWGAPQGGRSLDVCAANVRRKLHLYPQNGFTLNSVYRCGYQLQAVSPMKSPVSEPVAVIRTGTDRAATSLSLPAA